MATVWLQEHETGRYYFNVTFPDGQIARRYEDEFVMEELEINGLSIYHSRPNQSSELEYGWLKEWETGRYYMNYTYPNGMTVRRYEDEMHPETYSSEKVHVYEVNQSVASRSSPIKSIGYQSESEYATFMPSPEPGVEKHKTQQNSIDLPSEPQQLPTFLDSATRRGNRNLPSKRNARSARQAIPMKSVQTASDRHLLMFIRDAWEKEQEAVALLDSGSDDDWISTRLVEKLGFGINPSTSSLRATCGNNGTITSKGTVLLRWRVKHRAFELKFNVSDFEHIDVILGYEFLTREGVIHWSHSGLYPLISASEASEEEKMKQEAEKQKQAEGRRRYEERKERSDRYQSQGFGSSSSNQTSRASGS